MTDGITMNNGITDPFKVTQEPPNVVGSGLEVLGAPIGLRLDPWTEINPSPVNGCVGSAVFTTFEICGCAVAASKWRFASG